jgi:CBS domain containing-hemolysin-like protein
MESLALLISILLGISFLSGPIGLLLTSTLAREFSRNYKALWVIRKLVIVIISLAGISVSLMFILNQIPITPKLLAIAGLALNTVALKREFFREKPWRSFFRPGYNDPNGPAGQS